MADTFEVKNLSGNKDKTALIEKVFKIAQQTPAVLELVRDFQSKNISIDEMNAEEIKTLFGSILEAMFSDRRLTHAF